MLRILAYCMNLIWLFGWMTGMGLQHADAQDVLARLSSREAYVDSPIILQLQIANASQYELPPPPQIDGCDVQLGGQPAQSSQITIINGRRSQRQSVAQQYLITPLRPGNFEIPSLAVSVDGRVQHTRPLQFVATQSETGDLMFVQIEGEQDRVYVGQPLDLKLKIWIKPYRDAQLKIDLSEGDMWQLISQQTAWGIFADRLQELAENRQRPAGNQVSRSDGQGNMQAYYLYEIDHRIYPTRPGKIDVDNIRIVLNYPTELARSRDPLEGFFEDSSLGGSLLNRLMEDEFFSSPFGRRLTVAAARPVSGTAVVDDTEVLPVPTDGRPSDYRGAVGRYRIAAQAQPVRVDAGEPITLRLEVTGDGPMELVQAPPLANIADLTADFKVADEALAGFVQDNTKIFSTTIRPLREGIERIPPIPFSYFDPESETFQTAYTDPIPITVDRAETLSLEAIVAGRPNRITADIEAKQPAEQWSPWGESSPALVPDFSIDESLSVLTSQSLASHRWPFWVGLALPAGIWLMLVCWLTARWMLGLASHSVAPARRCQKDIDRAHDTTQLHAILTAYALARVGLKPDQSSAEAMGALRVRGMSSLANEFESFLQRLVRRSANEGQFAELQNAARQLVQKTEAEWRRFSKRPSMFSNSPKGSRGSAVANAVPGGKGSTLGSLAATAVVCGSLANAVLGQSEDRGVPHVTSLSRQQQEIVFAEANQLYRQAQDLKPTDAFASSQAFLRCAEKYQLLVDSGIRNAELYRNLGNAYLQADKLGMALANYHRCLNLKPGDPTATDNLRFAEQRIVASNSRMVASHSKSAPPLPAISGGNSLPLAESILQPWVQAVASLSRLVRPAVLAGIAMLFSSLFWATLVARLVGFPIKYRYAAILIAPAVLSIAVVVTRQYIENVPSGIIISQDAVLRLSDGHQFDAVTGEVLPEGIRVWILGQRNNWVQVNVLADQQGWLPADDLEVIGPMEKIEGQKSYREPTVRGELPGTDSSKVPEDSTATARNRASWFSSKI